MALFYLFACLLLILNGNLANADDNDPCPFSDDCKCPDYDPDHPYSVSTVYCKSKKGFPVFHAPAGKKYNVTTLLSLFGKVDVMPANALSIFQSILQLDFQQDGKTVDQKWDKDAFLGPTVTYELHVQSLGKVLPLPKSFDGSKLRSLKITYSNTELGKDAFAGLDALKNLDFHHTQITKIDDQTFSPVKHTLTQLQLVEASLTEFPTKALAAFTQLSSQLESADLSENEFNSVDLSNFPPVSNVHWYINNFYHKDSLITLNVTDPKKIGYNVVFAVTHTTLETIDPKIEEVLKNIPTVQLDISYNRVKCHGLGWMAKYLPQVHTTDSYCTDMVHKRLCRYLLDNGGVGGDFCPPGP
jgi:hypothetical protein